MPLSAEEQRRLAELEESLAADDPDFARSFSRRASAARQPTALDEERRASLRRAEDARRRTERRRVVLGWAVVVLGLAGIVGGNLVSRVLAVAGFLVMMVGVGMLLAGSPAAGRVTPIQHGAYRVQPRRHRRTTPSSAAPGSFTSRMEERWRRRQSR